jgi:hypothetical protein
VSRLPFSVSSLRIELPPAKRVSRPIQHPQLRAPGAGLARGGRNKAIGPFGTGTGDHGCPDYPQVDPRLIDGRIRVTTRIRGVTRWMRLPWSGCQHD